MECIICRSEAAHDGLCYDHHVADLRASEAIRRAFGIEA
jgi:hypothetical protein